LAGSAFKDAEVIKLFSNFTPILVDGVHEPDVAKKFGANGWPHIAFADAKGEPVGQPIIGYMETPVFLQRCEAIAKKVKPGKPSKDYVTLTAARTEMDQAVAKKQTAAALAAIGKIEKVNRPGPILDAAVAAKKQLLEDGRRRFDAAKEASKGDGKDAALKDLRKLAQEYKGTDVGTDAAKLVKELEPPPDAAK
jgi:hypothetical protein